MPASSHTSQPLVIRAAGKTDIGCLRERNEDAYLVDAENGIFIVADGVGGHAGGDIAAQMATTLLPDIIKRRIAESPEPRSSADPAIGSILADSVQELGRRLEENAYTADEAVRLERDVRAFIEETVRLDMTRIDPLAVDWAGPDGQRFVEQIFTDAYDMLEGE